MNTHTRKTRLYLYYLKNGLTALRKVWFHSVLLPNVYLKHVLSVLFVTHTPLEHTNSLLLNYDTIKLCWLTHCVQHNINLYGNITYVAMITSLWYGYQYCVRLQPPQLTEPTSEKYKSSFKYFSVITGSSVLLYCVFSSLCNFFMTGKVYPTAVRFSNYNSFTEERQCINK